MSDEIQVFVDSNIGVSGTTEVHVKKTEEGYEARMGVALLGTCNMSDEDFKACGYNPFHEDFHDNYVKGLGATQELALEAMKQDLRKMSDSLWD